VPGRLVRRGAPHRVPALSAGAIDPNHVLGNISGGRVLDVATGTGGFVRFLLDGLGRGWVVLPQTDRIG
jgi:hypothetical protein